MFSSRLSTGAVEAWALASLADAIAAAAQSSLRSEAASRATALAAEEMRSGAYSALNRARRWLATMLRASTT